MVVGDPLTDLWSRHKYLAALLPASIVALSLCCDLIRFIRFPRLVYRAYAYLTSPFQNFLHLEDLQEVSGPVLTRRPSRWKTKTMLFLSMLEVLFLLLRLAIDWSQHMPFLNDIALLIAWFYAISKLCLRPPSTPPYLTFLFYIMIFLSSSIITVGMLETGNYQLEIFILSIVDIIVSLSLIYIVGTFPVKEYLPGPSVAIVHETPSNAETVPEDNVTLWQWCTFSFVEPIFRVAQKGRLEPTDVWTISPFYKHKNLFLKYLEYCARHPTHSLLRFLIASNSLDIILDVVLELWSAVAVFGCVYSLQRILSALESTPRALPEAYFFAFVTFVLQLSFAQVDLFQIWHSKRSYQRTRGQLFCIIHYKALKRRDLIGAAGSAKEESITSINGADLGKIVNLMQGDGYTLAERFWHPSTVLAATVRLILSLLFLYRVIGVSAFAGVVVVLVAYALNWPLAKANIYITRQSWKARDVRMSGVNELFQNIRFLKLYGWTGPWTDRVLGKREKELSWRVKENICAVLISFVWIWVPSAMALFSFLFYTVVAGGRLTVSKTFTSLALFSFLRGPMLQLPDEMMRYLHAYVSYQRICTFLKEGDVSDWASTLTHIPGPGDKELDRIGFKDAHFVWYEVPGEPDSRERFKLGPLNMNFPLGKLTLITGSTASGKSALLNALLGELYCISGEVHAKKSGHLLAYCAQNPWLEHATIRDNIIFHSDRGFDEERYHTVVEACALPRDLNMFEAGDLTEIGEKGVTLSGGQRARVALARALYSDAKCLLLDDPLAAVDMHTARHIVEFCFKGDIMKGRTVILATHHISMCLPVSSYIVELSGGEVIRQGTVTELKASGQLKMLLDTEGDSIAAKDKFSDGTTKKPENEVDEIGVTESDNHHWSRKSPMKGKLVDAEYRAEGRVSLATYTNYARAAGWFSWALTLGLMVLIRLIQVANDLFLANWSEAFEDMPSERIRLRMQIAFDTFVMAKPPYPLDRLPSPNDDTKPWLFVYLLISVAFAIVTLAYISLGYYVSLQASRKLFTGMLARLSRAPARFFDVTPLGRVLNRFSKDINTVDSVLQQSARSAITGVLEFLASFLFIVAIIPKFAPFAVFIAWLYVRIAPPYIRAARDLRRLESVSMSPAFSGFDELLKGVTHIRAFGMERRYHENFYKKIDLFQGFDHVYWLAADWLTWRYDCLGSVVVFLTTTFAIYSGASDGFTAIVIVQAGVFAEASRQLVRVLAQLELDFNSVERVGEYTEAPQEAPAIVHEKRPPAYWPSSDGSLVVEDLVVRYAPDLPAVLNNLNFTVHPGEKIGVVGRTGSGKSTLALSLLRVVEPSSGRIILDGIDITSIGLEDLRTKITTVSQDVALFTGSIRSNLDPFGEHSDLECMDALERCHFRKRDRDLRERDFAFLDTMIGPTGSLSAGERQLIALARAILRRSQVIIMDEATSQIDRRLDDQIQKTVREELSNAMVVTIAHRLKTIIDYDRILVLGESGHILEFDTPHNLFKKPDSVFKELCKRSTDWDELKNTVEGSASGQNTSPK